MNNQLYLKNVASLQYDQSRCTGCTRCIEVCPHGVFKMKSTKAYIHNKDRCMECGACQINCPADAIEVNSGVGCAYAVINGMIKNSDPSCDCGSDKTDC